MNSHIDMGINLKIHHSQIELLLICPFIANFVHILVQNCFYLCSQFIHIVMTISHQISTTQSYSNNSRSVRNLYAIHAIQ